jgi:hypothetical protein
MSSFCPEGDGVESGLGSISAQPAETNLDPAWERAGEILPNPQKSEWRSRLIARTTSFSASSGAMRDCVTAIDKPTLASDQALGRRNSGLVRSVESHFRR